MVALVELKSAHKRYGAVAALAGLDLQVQAGEVLALLGPNGAGKTTAISLMLGLQRPDGGSARLFGRPPQSVEARRQVGVMMQDVALPVNLTVRELIAQTASYYPAPMSTDAAIELAGVAPIAHRWAGRLSGGQKRQAQFALAVCGAPALLFLDEPTANLDVVARERLWDGVRQLVARGASVVLTTHYIDEAEALADRVVVIAGGRAIAGGTVPEMRAAVVRKEIACITSVTLEAARGWPEVGEAHRSGETLVLTAADAEAVVRRLLAADPRLSGLEVRRAGLSEAIALLTGGGAK